MIGVLKIDFLRGPDVKALARGRIIKSMLVDHDYTKGPLPPGVLSPDQLGALIERLQVAGDEALSHDTQKIRIHREIRKEYNKAIKNLASHLEILANGDVSKLQNLGFDLRQPPKKGARSQETLPTVEFTARHGLLEGTILIHIKLLALAAYYELQIASADPTQEENWQLYDTYIQPTKILITDRTPGQRYWFRVRARGVNGYGPWSPPTPLMSL